MTDISDDYEPLWDDDYDPDPRDDYEDDDWDYDDGRDGYEPEPDYEAISRYEHERTMRGLSPLGRVRYQVSGFIWRHTWRWRTKIGGRRLTGRPIAESDEPPF